MPLSQYPARPPASTRDPYRPAERSTDCPACGSELRWNREDGHPGTRPEAVEDRRFVVTIREPDGKLVNGLSRRHAGPDGQPFAGPWAALTQDEAERLADAYNADEREGGTAQVIELFRYDRDPEWPEEFA